MARKDIKQYRKFEESAKLNVTVLYFALSSSFCVLFRANDVATKKKKKRREAKELAADSRATCSRLRVDHGNKQISTVRPSTENINCVETTPL